jgi:hypothetical protein
MQRQAVMWLCDERMPKTNWDAEKQQYSVASSRQLAREREIRFGPWPLLGQSVSITVFVNK